MSFPRPSANNWLAFCFVGLLLGALTGCGEEPLEAFTLDNKEGFMTACVDSVADSELMTVVCGCVIEELELYDYDEFESLDGALVEDSEAQLPAAVIDVVADCFIEAADL